MYLLLRNLLFLLPPEATHHLVLNTLNILNNFKLLPKREFKSPVSVMGIDFPNPVGLAGGFDRHCEYYPSLKKLGFGFIELGTITLNPQPGNSKPRIFRLPEAEALINRMGFFSKGLDYALNQIQNTKYDGILGISIAKNFSTPIDEAVRDYLSCLEKIYPFADYIAINISSPNTPGLRNLQYGDYLNALLVALKEKQKQLTQIYHRKVPLVIKIAPDSSDVELKQIIECLLEREIEGVIATNTTLSREHVGELRYADEQGGLSGKPLFEKSLSTVKYIKQIAQNDLAIIGCGGIMNATNALQMLEAGADLLQIYTGLIYYGPNLIKEIVAVLR